MLYPIRYLAVFGWFRNPKAPDPKVYLDFKEVLKPETNIGSALDDLVGAFIKGAYNITYSFEKVYNSIFKLLGFESYKGLNNFAKAFLAIGWSILAIAILVVALEIIFGKRTALHQMLVGIISALAVIIVLPTFMGTMGKLTNQANEYVSQTVTGQKQGEDNIAIKVAQDNIVDIAGIAQDGFNQTPEQMVKDDKQTSGINAQNIEAVDFGEMLRYGKGDSGGYGTDDFKKVKTKYTTSNGQPVNAGDILSYKLSVRSEGNGKYTNDVSEISKNVLFFKNINHGYRRYSFNALSIITEYIILIVLFVVTAIKTIRIILELAILKVLAPAVALSGIKSSERAKEIFKTVVHSYEGIVVQASMIFFFMIFIKYAQNIGNTLNFNIFQKGLFVTVVYMGALFGVFSGSGMVEKWLGVKQSSGAELLATAGAGYAVGKGISGAGKVVGNAVSGGSKALQSSVNRTKSNLESSNNSMEKSGNNNQTNGKVTNETSGSSNSTTNSRNSKDSTSETKVDDPKNNSSETTTDENNGPSGNYNEPNGDHGSNNYNDPNENYGNDNYNELNGDHGSSNYNNPNGNYGNDNYNELNGDHGSSNYNNPNGNYGNDNYNEPNGNHGSGNYNNQNRNYGNDSYNEPNGNHSNDSYNNPNGNNGNGKYSQPNGSPNNNFYSDDNKKGTSFNSPNAKNGNDDKVPNNNYNNVTHVDPNGSNNHLANNGTNGTDGKNGNNGKDGINNKNNKKENKFNRENSNNQGEKGTDEKQRNIRHGSGAVPTNIAKSFTDNSVVKGSDGGDEMSEYDN